VAWNQFDACTLVYVVLAPVLLASFLYSGRYASACACRYAHLLAHSFRLHAATSSSAPPSSSSPSHCTAHASAAAFSARLVRAQETPPGFVVGSSPYVGRCAARRTTAANGKAKAAPPGAPAQRYAFAMHDAAHRHAFAMPRPVVILRFSRPDFLCIKKYFVAEKKKFIFFVNLFLIDGDRSAARRKSKYLEILYRMASALVIMYKNSVILGLGFEIISRLFCHPIFDGLPRFWPD